MKIPPKYIQFLIKILFTIVFIIHTSFIALKIWKPDVPEIRIIKKHLKKYAKSYLKKEIKDFCFLKRFPDSELFFVVKCLNICKYL